MSYKYHTPQEYDRIIRETEAEMDRRAEQQARADELERVRQWTLDPANAAKVAEIRAKLDGVAPQRATPQRPAAPIGTPQNPIPANARFDPSHLKDQPVQISRIHDPLVR